jgi:FixJ family two-component response regulator
LSDIRPTIFIIDDDESIRKALGRLIRSAGFDVVTFASAEEFLQSDTTPACMILDVHLPGMSGPELQEHLVARGRDVPVVFITAYPDNLPASGATDFLVKPFEERDLLETVRRAIGLTTDLGRRGP